MDPRSICFATIFHIKEFVAVLSPNGINIRFDLPLGCFRTFLLLCLLCRLASLDLSANSFDFASHDPLCVSHVDNWALFVAILLSSKSF